MTTALLIIDVQQGLCEGEQVAFESPQIIFIQHEFTPRAAPHRCTASARQS